jgi:hypothetical protein
VVDGTSDLLVSHGPPSSTTYSTHEMRLSCDKEGRITRIERRSVDRGELDFDGDGYPEREDCDETDPSVHQGC